MGKKDPSEKTITLSSTGGAAQAIGPYRLLQKVGEGGMGEVWIAEQHKPIRRKVALKLIKAGMDTKQVIARFESEKQALAMMDHPAIAKVFDAGESHEGRPYFVMEYVQGIPITTYCDQNRLTTHERLELFMRVCEGVQHAHQKAIIHRDLKPSNILIAIQDGRPVPKIIDFGVAKATAQSLTERTMYTELGMLIGTPEYMSPEQAEMSGQNVDTRTDVYSLGAILYELLTGALPFDAKELRRAGIDEIRRRIREEDPPKPSTKLSTMGEGTTISAQNRRMEPPALMRQVKGDLDWITMKALEKDRTRRYGAPSEIAADIDRFLHHQPIVARPPSTAYRARKFARRHRVGVGLVSALAVLLIAFSVATTLQARRIARERDRANREAETSQQVSDFLTGLFKVPDPSESRGNSITAREILDKGAQEIAKKLAGQPRIQARLMVTMGDVYANLGLYPQAQALYERSLDIRRKILGEDDPDTLVSLRKMGTLFMQQGQYPQAEAYLRQAVESSIRILGRDHPDTLKALNNLGGVLFYQRKLDEAERHFREALDIKLRLFGENDNQTLASINNLAGLFFLQGKLADAEEYYRKALRIGYRINGKDHPDSLTYLDNLGRVLLQQGKLTESESCIREALEGERRVLGGNHPDTLRTLVLLGEFYMKQDKFVDAENHLRTALIGLRSTLSEDNVDIAVALENLGGALNAQGRYGEAEQLLRQCLANAQRALDPAAYEISSAMCKLGEALAGQKKFGEAEPLLVRGAEGILVDPQSADQTKRRTVDRVVKFYTEWGKPEKAAMWKGKYAPSRDN